MYLYLQVSIHNKFFLEYFQGVVNSLREKTGGDDCVNNVKQGIEQVEIMLKMNPEVIEKEFKLVLKRDFNYKPE